MKRCPKCSRTFPDDNQKFCTIDGGLLVAGDQPFDPNATIQGSANMALPTAPPPEQPASNRPSNLNETTAASAPTAVLPRQTGPTNLPTSSNLPSPQSSQAPPPPSAPLTPPQQAAPPPAQSAPPPSTPPRATPSSPKAPLPPAQRAPVAPVAGAAPVAKKKSKLPLILGILALLLVLGLGGAVAAFFLVIKPRLDARKAEPPVIVRESPPENTNINTNTNTNTSETKPPETTQPEFVAPPDTTKFTNSQANLDGKLAEHYFDFSFYYPNNWAPDPKAGIAGSGNFAKVERRLPPDFTQENFAVRWYESKGTYVEDLADYPKLVEKFSNEIKNFFPGYRKVSEGPTKVNSQDAYEFKWEGLSKGTEKGDLHLWGRVVFVPSGVSGSKNGAILSMFTTSLAPELSSVEDVGTRGEMPVILESFRFTKSP
jgi:hypothetical protein